jgi:cell division protein FtsW (lipid II flippase)
MPTEGATVKEQVTGWAVSVGSGLGAALAGAPWWAVVLVVAVVLGSTYGMVYVLSKNPRIKRVSTFLITVDTTEPEELPPKVDTH